jgi:hypothetical protein
MSDTTATILHGGKEVIVRVSADLNETVFVRQLAIREKTEYLAAQDDEDKIIALVTGRPDKWIHALPIAQAEKLVLAADEVNGDFFHRWLTRRADRIERVAPGTRERMLAARVSKITSPEPPSSAASPSTRQPVNHRPSSG